MDYVDLIFCHRPDTTTPIEETVRAMNFVIDQVRPGVLLDCASFLGSIGRNARGVTSLRTLGTLTPHLTCGAAGVQGWAMYWGAPHPQGFFFMLSYRMPLRPSSQVACAGSGA